MWWRRIGIGALASLGVAVPASAPASAAELKISYVELAAVVQSFIGDAKLHLHNVPGGLFSLTPSSYLSIAGQQAPISLPAKSFELLGSTYAYYVNNLDSSSIRAAAAPSAIRLTVTFKSSGADLTGGCVEGECLLADALPNIAWSAGTVAIDLVPVRAGAGVALQAKTVTIGGNLRARCDNKSGFFSLGACDLALPWANRTITRLKPEIAATLKDTINAAETQAELSKRLKPFLTLGPAGEIGIDSVTSDAKSVIVKFRIGVAPGG